MMTTEERRIPAGQIRPGDTIRVTRTAAGWAPGRTRRNSIPGVVMVARDLGPTRHRRYRLIIRVGEATGGLVTVHSSARESWIKDSTTDNNSTIDNEG